MTAKPARDFNDKAKTYLYSVSVRARQSRSRADFTPAAREMMDSIRDLAKAQGLEKTVRLRMDDSTLGKLGIFFMTAPEKFAAAVKKMDGVAYVERPADAKSTPAARRRGPGPRR